MEIKRAPMDEKLVERILTYLTFCEDFVPLQPQLTSKLREQGWDTEVVADFSAYGSLPLTHFQGAEIISGGKWLESGENSMLDADQDPDLPELDLGNWSFCAILDPVGDLPESKDLALYKLLRCRRVPLSEFRGWPQKWRTGRLAEISQAVIYNSGKYTSTRVLYEHYREHWETVYVGVAASDIGSHDDTELINGAKSMALTRWYDWRVEIGFQTPGRTSLPTISIPTSPGGAKAAHKLRDLPPGKSRRDALRHWVSTHQREAEPEPITIWAHLRGATEFTQNGMKCRIVPSQYDLKKAAEYQAKMKTRRK